jgi:tetratricopeptide (TPR) repeat protein
MSINPYESPQEPPPPVEVGLPLRSIVGSSRLLRNIIVCIAPPACVAVLLLVLPRDAVARVLGKLPLGVFGPLDPMAAGVFLLLLGLLLGFAAAYWLWRRQVLQPLRELSGRIVSHPTVAEHYLARGALYLDETKERARALEDFSRAIELAPRTWKGYALRGKTHCLCGDFERAIADVTQAVLLATDAEQLTGDQWWLYDIRSAAHFHLKEYDRAAADVTEAVRLLSECGGGPGDQIALMTLYYRRAQCHLHQGQPDAASEDFAQAHRIDVFCQNDPRRSRQLLGCLGHLVFELVMYTVIFGILLATLWVIWRLR